MFEPGGDAGGTFDSSLKIVALPKISSASTRASCPRSKAVRNEAGAATLKTVNGWFTSLIDAPQNGHRVSAGLVLKGAVIV